MIFKKLHSKLDPIHIEHQQADQHVDTHDDTEKTLTTRTHRVNDGLETLSIRCNETRETICTPIIMKLHEETKIIVFGNHCRYDVSVGNKVGNFEHGAFLAQIAMQYITNSLNLSSEKDSEKKEDLRRRNVL